MKSIEDLKKSFAAAVHNRREAAEEPFNWSRALVAAAVSILCGGLYSYLLLLVYMNNNGFFAHDVMFHPGAALPLMTIQFDFLALVLAFYLFGFAPASVWLKISWRSLERSKRSILIPALIILMGLNAWTLHKVLNLNDSYKEALLLTGFFGALFITVVYALPVKGRWLRLTSFFILLAGSTVVMHERVSFLVSEALSRAKLGGDIQFQASYAENRSVSKRELAVAEGRKAPSLYLLGSATAFECSGVIQGRIVLDGPENLYVRIEGDECQQPEPPTADGNKHKPTPVTVIEKTRLRSYTVFSS